MVPTVEPLSDRPASTPPNWWPHPYLRASTVFVSPGGSEYTKYNVTRSFLCHLSSLSTARFNQAGKFLSWGLCSTLLKQRIQSKQIFNYLCWTVIYAAGVLLESQRTGLTLTESGRHVTQQPGVIAPVQSLFLTNS